MPTSYLTAEQRRIDANHEHHPTVHHVGWMQQAYEMRKERLRDDVFWTTVMLVMAWDEAHKEYDKIKEEAPIRYMPVMAPAEATEELEPKEKIKCCACEKDFSKEEVEKIDDSYFCENCKGKETFVCGCCDERHDAENSTWVRDDDYRICEACYDRDYFSCEGCDTVHHNDSHAGDGYCEGCYEGESDGESYETFSPKSVDIGRVKNTLLPLPIAFGLELEADGGDDGLSHDRINKIRRETVFGCKDDGSLENGMEFYSPKLRGDPGLKHLKDFLTLAKHFPVQETCGFHLHLDGAGFNWLDVLRIWKVYYAVEPAILTILPKARRQNKFCIAISQYPEIWGILKGIKTRKDFLYEFYNLKHQGFEKKKMTKNAYQFLHRVMHDHYNHKRYYGLNVHSWYYRKSLEIRYHSGTFDYEKIVNWIIINMSLMKAATSGVKPEKFLLGGKAALDPAWDLMNVALEKYPDTKKYVAERRAKFETYRPIYLSKLPNED